MKGDKIKVDTIPTKESTEQFWKTFGKILQYLTRKLIGLKILMIHSVRVWLILSIRSTYKPMKNQ